MRSDLTPVTCPFSIHLLCEKLLIDQIGDNAKRTEYQNGIQKIPAETLVPFFQQGGREGFFTIKAKLVHLQYI